MAALPKSDDDNDSEEDDVAVMIGKDEGKVLSPWLFIDFSHKLY
jgi:hypothetical protein